MNVNDVEIFITYNWAPHPKFSYTRKNAEKIFFALYILLVIENLNLLG